MCYLIGRIRRSQKKTPGTFTGSIIMFCWETFCNPRMFQRCFSPAQQCIHNRLLAIPTEMSYPIRLIIVIIISICIVLPVSGSSELNISEYPEQLARGDKE